MGGEYARARRVRIAFAVRKKKVFRSQLLYFKNAHFNLPASLPRHFNMGNVASGKRRRTTVAGDWTKPTFDVDESVAAAVFAHHKRQRPPRTRFRFSGVEKRRHD